MGNLMYNGSHIGGGGGAGSADRLKCVDPEGKASNVQVELDSKLEMVPITQADYNNLSEEEKNKEVLYHITDGKDLTASNIECTDADGNVSTVQAELDKVNNNLTNEDDEQFIFGKKDGVRGFFTDPSRADDSFVPFKSLDGATAVKVDYVENEEYSGTASLTYTATKKCIAFFYAVSLGGGNTQNNAKTSYEVKAGSPVILLNESGNFTGIRTRRAVIAIMDVGDSILCSSYHYAGETCGYVEVYTVEL